MLFVFSLFFFALLQRLSAQLCVLSPESLRLAYASRDRPGCIEGATATFAAPGPEDRLRGLLSWQGLGCSDQGETSRQGGLPQIHLARRGRCSFAQKSAVSAAAGASALLVADFEASEATDAQVAETLVAGVQGQLSLVPTLLIGQQAALGLINATRAGERVEVELFWGYPRPRAIVDVWLPATATTSGSSSSLLRQLAPMARELGDAVQIRPHWRVVRLDPTSQALARRCARASPQLCTATGTSEDLEEVVRYHCILQGYPKLWWPYVESPCHGDDCSASGGLSKLQAAAIERCVASQGLSFLEDDREAAAWGSAESIAIRINSWRYSGPVQADAILRTLCHHLPPSLACRVLLEEPSPGRGLAAWKLLGLCIVTALLGRGFRGTLLWAILRSCKWQKRA